MKSILSNICSLPKPTFTTNEKIGYYFLRIEEVRNVNYYVTDIKYVDNTNIKKVYTRIYLKSIIGKYVTRKCYSRSVDSITQVIDEHFSSSSHIYIKPTHVLSYDDKFNIIMIDFIICGIYHDD